MALPLDSSKLQARVAARKAAEAAISLISESIEGDPLHFWKVIRDHALEKAPSGNHPLTQPMTEEERHRFERVTVPYGEFQNQFVQDVPLSRLDWYEKRRHENEEFNRQLSRYLRNETVMERLKKEFDDEE